MSTSSKTSLSLRLLKASVTAVFFLSALSFLLSYVVTFAPHQLSVYDGSHNLIGHVAMPTPPNDYTTAIAFVVACLSGLQLWSLHFLGTALDSKQNA